jgi:hypothetical protein
LRWRSGGGASPLAEQPNPLAEQPNPLAEQPNSPVFYCGFGDTRYGMALGLALFAITAQAREAPASIVLESFACNYHDGKDMVTCYPRATRWSVQFDCGHIPIMAREYRSMTTARYNQPSSVHKYVISPVHF